MILEFEKYRTDLEALRAKLHDVGDGLHIDHMQQELTELHEEQGEPGFWDNLERSTHVTRKISQLEAKIKHYEWCLKSAKCWKSCAAIPTRWSWKR